MNFWANPIYEKIHIRMTLSILRLLLTSCPAFPAKFWKGVNAVNTPCFQPPSLSAHCTLASAHLNLPQVHPSAAQTILV